MAIAHTLSNWEVLTRYVEDGDLAIDNNRAGRALRARLAPLPVVPDGKGVLRQ